MASGDFMAVFHPHAAEPPTSNFATRDVRNAHRVLDFDATTDETAYFTGVLPANYAGGGLTVHLSVAASTATSGASRWQVNIERINSGGPDIDADSFSGTDGSVGITANGTSGIPTEGTTTHTSGANMDSLAAGEPYRLRVKRDADGTSGTDDMTGDAELVALWITET